jgi:hypothetical protein
MVVPSGGPTGPYVSNNDSTCSDKTYTPLAPGTDGGLVTGSYQAEPDPAFDGSGNSLAGRITKPALFYGVAFSTSTNATDPQTTTHVSTPSISAASGKLSGDLRAFAASWNRQEFNQGAPKPDGSSPGNTAAPSGTYNSATGAFTLDWASQIQGGPFNNFTGQWHFEGTFTPTQGQTSTTSPPSPTNTNSQTATGSGNTGPAGGASGGTSSRAPAAPTTVADAAASANSNPSTTLGTLTPQSTDQAAAAGSEAATASHSRKSSSSVPLMVVAALVLIAAASGAWYALSRRSRTAP